MESRLLFAPHQMVLHHRHRMVRGGDGIAGRTEAGLELLRRSFPAQAAPARAARQSPRRLRSRDWKKILVVPFEISVACFSAFYRRRSGLLGRPRGEFLRARRDDWQEALEFSHGLGPPRLAHHVFGEWE